MSIITKSVYDDLVKNRQELLQSITELTNKQEDLTVDIADSEAFLAGFDDTQAALENLKTQLQAQQEAQDLIIENANNAINQLENEMSALNEANEILQGEIEELQASEGDPDLIAAKQAQLEANEALIKSKEGEVDKNKQKIDQADKDKDSLSDQIQNADENLEENDQRKNDLEDGQLDEKKLNLIDVTKELKSTQDQYNERFCATCEDGLLIANFEKQQLTRDANLGRASNNAGFNKLVPTEERELLTQENAVIDEVIGVEFGELSEEEKDKRNEAYDAGAKTDVDSCFLNADDARSLTQRSIWSTKEVSCLIKDACLAGRDAITVPEVLNSTVWALQRSGFTVTTTGQSTGDYYKEGVRIQWTNIGENP